MDSCIRIIEDMVHDLNEDIDSLTTAMSIASAPPKPVVSYDLNLHTFDFFLKRGYRDPSPVSNSGERELYPRDYTIFTEWHHGLTQERNQLSEELLLQHTKTMNSSIRIIEDLIHDLYTDINSLARAISIMPIPTAGAVPYYLKFETSHLFHRRVPDIRAPASPPGSLPKHERLQVCYHTLIHERKELIKGLKQMREI